MGPHTKGRQWSSRGTHWEVPVGEGWAWVEELGVKMTTTHCINVWNQQTIKGWEETDPEWRLCVLRSSLPYRSLWMYVIHVCMFTYTCMYINSHDMLIHCPPFYLPLLLEKIYQVGIPVKTPCLVSFGNLRTTISKSLWPCDFPSFGSDFIHGLRKLHAQKKNETLDWSSSGVVLASCWPCSPWWGSSVSCSSWWFLTS